MSSKVFAEKRRGNLNIQSNISFINKQDDVSLAKEGNREAFCRLIKNHEDSLYRVSKAILKSEEFCADAVQETIIRAYKGIASLKDNTFFKTWLIKIAINECNRIYNKRRKIEVKEHAMKDELPYTDSSAENIEVRQAVSGLEQELRVTVVLFYFEDVPVKDIACILGIPEGTVKSRLSRARSKLLNSLSAGEVM